MIRSSFVRSHCSRTLCHYDDGAGIGPADERSEANGQSRCAAARLLYAQLRLFSHLGVRAEGADVAPSREDDLTLSGAAAIVESATLNGSRPATRRYSVASSEGLAFHTGDVECQL